MRRRRTAFTNRCAVCLAFGAAWLVATVGGPLVAGTGSIDPNDGTIDFTVKFTFPPDQDDIDLFKAAVNQASAILCDATDGQIRFGTVRLTGGSKANFDQADVIVYLDDGRSTADNCLEEPGDPCFALGSPGSSIKFKRDPGKSTFDSLTLAHEFGHLAFDLGESYDEQNRLGACWGIGRSIECADLSPTRNSIMQQNDPGCPPFADLTELSTASTHDTVRGDTEAPECTPKEELQCERCGRELHPGPGDSDRRLRRQLRLEPRADVRSARWPDLRFARRSTSDPIRATADHRRTTCVSRHPETAYRDPRGCLATWRS